MKTVSVIIPYYRKIKYIKKSIDSVLNQKFKNFEIIIVHDDPRNKDFDYLLELKKNNNKIRLIKNKKNLGAGFSRNKGIKLAKSKYIAFLDSDDFWPENKLEVQIHEMLNNKYDFSYTDIKYFVNNNFKNTKKTDLPKIYDFDKFIKKSTMSTSSILIKRSIVKQIDFKEVKHEDYLFKCELLKSGNISFKVFNTFVYYRITSNNRSSNKFSNLYNLWKINKLFNKLSLIDNFKSIVSISINSLKTYGWK